MGPSGPVPLALCGYLAPLGCTGPMLGPSRTRHMRLSLATLAVRHFGSTSAASGVDQGGARSVSMQHAKATQRQKQVRNGAVVDSVLRSLCCTSQRYSVSEYMSADTVLDWPKGGSPYREDRNQITVIMKQA